MKIPIGYSEVFTDRSVTIPDLLSNIDRSTMLKVAVHFLAVGHDIPKEDVANWCNRIFCDNNRIIAEQIKAKLLDLNKDSNRNLINPYSSLSLFEFCFDQLSDSGSTSLEEAEILIFKAYLLFNQQLKDNLNKGTSSASHVTGDVTQFAASRLAEGYQLHPLLNVEKNELWKCQLIKVFKLFTFMENHPKGQPILAQFLNDENCESWIEYLQQILPFVRGLIRKENEGFVQFNPTDENNAEILRRFSLNNSSPINDDDFKKVRATPIFELSDGFQLIFDPFVIELLFKGVYFKLEKAYATLNGEENRKNFRSFYCLEFSEKTLLYQTFKTNFSTDHIHFTGDELDKLKISGACDYYLRMKKWNSIFLVESKDIQIAASIKGSFDFETIKSAFEKKLYQEIFEDGKIGKRAVLQLTENVRKVLSKEFKMDDKYNPSSVGIYPILVLYDYEYNAAGLNYLINQWFAIELEKLRIQGFDISRVRKITLIDIDTLIYFENPLWSCKFNMVIDSYHKYISHFSSNAFSSKVEAMHYLVQETHSFSFYYRNYCILHRSYENPNQLDWTLVELFNKAQEQNETK